MQKELEVAYWGDGTLQGKQTITVGFPEVDVRPVVLPDEVWWKVLELVPEDDRDRVEYMAIEVGVRP